jgi:hypothetical protein
MAALSQPAMDFDTGLDIPASGPGLIPDILICNESDSFDGQCGFVCTGPVITSTSTATGFHDALMDSAMSRRLGSHGTADHVDSGPELSQAAVAQFQPVSSLREQPHADSQLHGMQLGNDGHGPDKHSTTKRHRHRIYMREWRKRMKEEDSQH